MAVGPPRKERANDENGTCGRLSKTVVSWPVFGSGVTVPGSLIFTPDCSMSTNKRRGWVGVGWPRKTLPARGPRSGLTIVMAPNWELSGQAPDADLPTARCAAV